VFNNHVFVIADQHYYSSNTEHLTQQSVIGGAIDEYPVRLIELVCSAQEAFWKT